MGTLLPDTLNMDTLHIDTNIQAILHQATLLEYLICITYLPTTSAISFLGFMVRICILTMLTQDCQLPKLWLIPILDRLSHQLITLSHISPLPRSTIVPKTCKTRTNWVPVYCFCLRGDSQMALLMNPLNQPAAPKILFYEVRARPKVWRNI